MISEQDAKELVARSLGTKATDDNPTWTLKEFEAGWVIPQQREETFIRFGGNIMKVVFPGQDNAHRGAGTLVVERETGRLLLFPSSIPLDRITSQYPAVTHRGIQVNKA